MPQKNYYEAALAIAAIEMQQITPALQLEETASREPKRDRETRVEACTTRRFVDEQIARKGSYHGRHPDDIYITAPALAEVLDVSDETARRRLKYFKEQGILRVAADAGEKRLYYEMVDDFTGVNEENVRSESTIVDTAKRLLAAAEER